MNISTSTSNTTTGKPGIGSKIKGAVQVVHGLGENVRGTILGGVDTVVHGNSADNDATAAKGRGEKAEGLARMKGGPVAAGSARPAGSAPHGHTGQNYGNGVAAPAGEQSGVPTNPATETDYTGGVMNGGGAGTQAQHDSGNLVPGAGPAGTHTAGADMDPRHAQNYGQGDSATGNTGVLENAGAPGTQPSRAPGPGTGAHAQPLNAQPGYIEAEGQSYGQGVPGAPEQSDWQNRQAPHDSHAPVPGTGAPGAHGGGEAYPTKQQGYGATDAINQGNQSRDPNHPYHDHAAVAQRIPEYDSPGNMETQQRHDRPAGEPQHHRDDAISGAGVGGQPARGVSPKYVSTAGGPPADVGPQYRGEEML
ncbi:hypothetical protein DFH09DRAFT_1366112 [Mycena vulgaris]|nr:hypothetical protein DFH09DRAFT_1366112 [Mycena vulgaris]